MAVQRATTKQEKIETAAVASMMFGPHSGFMLSQKLMAETMRFWARRSRAYGELLETVAGASDPKQVLDAEIKFIERAQTDYRESADMATQLISASARDGAEELRANFKPEGAA